MLFGMGQAKGGLRGYVKGWQQLGESQLSFVCVAVLLPG